MGRSDKKHRLKIKNFFKDSWQVLKEEVASGDEDFLDDQLYVPGNELATWMLNLDDRVAFSKQTIRVARKDKNKLIWEVELNRSVQVEKIDTTN